MTSASGRFSLLDLPVIGHGMGLPRDISALGFAALRFGLPLLLLEVLSAALLDVSSSQFRMTVFPNVAFSQLGFPFAALDFIRTGVAVTEVLVSVLCAFWLMRPLIERRGFAPDWYASPLSSSQALLALLRPAAACMLLLALVRTVVPLANLQLWSRYPALYKALNWMSFDYLAAAGRAALMVVPSLALCCFCACIVLATRRSPLAGAFPWITGLGLGWGAMVLAPTTVQTWMSAAQLNAMVLKTAPLAAALVLASAILLVKLSQDEHYWFSVPYITLVVIPAGVGIFDALYFDLTAQFPVIVANSPLSMTLVWIVAEVNPPGVLAQLALYGGRTPWPAVLGSLAVWWITAVLCLDELRGVGRIGAGQPRQD